MASAPQKDEQASHLAQKGLYLASRNKGSRQRAVKFSTVAITAESTVSNIFTCSTVPFGKAFYASPAVD